MGAAQANISFSDFPLIRVLLCNDIHLFLFSAAAHEKPADTNPFIRTGKIFGGLIREVKRKTQHYSSDFKEGLNLRCAMAVVFIFFATLAPTITFGGLLGKKTDGWLGVQETLISTALCGILFALCSGQPLIIVGTTGPILVFEQATYEVRYY